MLRIFELGSASAIEGVERNQVRVRSGRWGSRRRFNRRKMGIFILLVWVLGSWNGGAERVRMVSPCPYPYVCLRWANHVPRRRHEKIGIIIIGFGPNIYFICSTYVRALLRLGGILGRVASARRVAFSLPGLSPLVRRLVNLPLLAQGVYFVVLWFWNLRRSHWLKCVMCQCALILWGRDCHFRAPVCRFVSVVGGCVLN